MVQYTSSLDSITSEKLQGFFVGWLNPPSPVTHLKLLSHSDEIILALDNGSGQVVGFITAISDRILTAHIPFLEVLPAFQGRGIGQELLRQMLERLNHLYAIDLICDSELTPFYETQGLRPVRGMMQRNYENQSGSGIT